MKKQATTPHSERQLKLAEAGILFVLILGATVFLGVRIFSGGQAPGPVAVVEQAPVFEASLATTTPIDTVEAVAPVEIETEVATLARRSPRVVTYALCEQAYLGGDYEGAAELFADYAREHPDNAWGHYMLGLSNWKAGDRDGAEAAFTAALDLKPDHVKSRINYGRVLLEMDRAQEAREQLEAALAVDAGNVDAQRVLGRAYHNLGLLDEAAASYRGALSVRGDDAWSLNNLGLVYIEQERFAEALPALAKAAQLKSDAACIQNNLGVALERTGYLKSAVAAYGNALASDAHYAKAELSRDRVAERMAGAGPAAVDGGLEADLASLAESFTVEAPVFARAEEAAAELVEVGEDESGIDAASTEPAADETGTAEPIEVASGDGGEQ